MPLTLHFLKADRAALPQVVEYLAERYAQGGVLDLDRVLMVVPAASAGRRLEELLVRYVAEHGLALHPSQPVTVGELPERLYKAQRPLASNLTQEYAWAAALRATEPSTLRALFREPPAVDDARGWRELAATLMRQHIELAADALHFGDVAKATKRLEQTYESNRWQRLRGIQEKYLAILEDLHLWDKQTARLVAIERDEAATECDILLIGTVDLNRAQRGLLHDVQTPVTALIHAPESWGERFDEYGTLRPAAWEKAELNISEAALMVAEGPEEQAGAVARALVELGGEYAADCVTVALPASSLTPLVEETLRECGAPVRATVGRPLRGSGPARLLEAAAAWLERDLYKHFAALVRHPDLENWLLHSQCDGPWLAALDNLQAERLPHQLKFWLEGLTDEEREQREKYAPLVPVYKHLKTLFEELAGGKRPLAEWIEPIMNFLRAVYGTQKYNRQADRPLLSAIKQLSSTYQQLAELPEALSTSVTAAEAIREGLGQLAEAQLPPEENPQAIELVGWLELPLDDAPVVIVAGLNEGFVPRSVNSDLFLPNSLRQELGLADNARRYARDAYALAMLAASRERLALIVGRRDAENNPLAPSRLLFTLRDPSAAARQAMRLFVDPATAERPPLLTAGGGPPPSRHGFTVPYPLPLAEPIEALSVTRFRGYIACPYRFYLGTVLGLGSVNDDAEELDGGVFGELAHDTLAILEHDDLRQCTDAEFILGKLNEKLDSLVRGHYGKFPLPAVGVQIEQVRARLAAFAEVQANWAAQGWRVAFTEIELDRENPALFEVDGQPFRLTGRIDRIDHHAETDRWALLDYKTSDTAKRPVAAHYSKSQGKWIDLQLPLYRHFAGPLNLEGELLLGYINLPKDTGKVKFELAAWTESELAEADEAAHEVIRGLRAANFWRPVEPAPDFTEEFAYICQDGVLERRLAEEPK